MLENSTCLSCISNFWTTGEARVGRPPMKFPWKNHNLHKIFKQGLTLIKNSNQYCETNVPLNHMTMRNFWKIGNHFFEETLITKFYRLYVLEIVLLLDQIIHQCCSQWCKPSFLLQISALAFCTLTQTYMLCKLESIDLHLLSGTDFKNIGYQLFFKYACFQAFRFMQSNGTTVKWFLIR